MFQSRKGTQGWTTPTFSILSVLLAGEGNTSSTLGWKCRWHSPASPSDICPRSA